jgi:hypothetical protein
VRDYLACVDELTTIKLVLQKKVEHFQALLQDVKKFEDEDTEAGVEINHPAGETSQARVIWGSRMIKAQHDSIDRLLLDLTQSMNAVGLFALLLGSQT